MPDETDAQNPAPSSDNLPGDIVDSVAMSNAKSVGEQPALLANLALADQIFNANLAQQQAIVNQQVIFQIQLAALAKCIQVLLAADVSEPQAIEQLTSRILEMFDQFNSKVEERLVASQKQMNDLMNKLRANTMTDKPEGS